MNRKDFLLSLSAMPLVNMNLHELKNITDGFPKSDKMPTIFIGHGSPMNALANNAFTKSLNQIGKNFEKPKAILVVSAHWLTMGKTYVSTNPFPKTIYDFGGFPDELFRVKYEPAGSPETAKEVIKEVKSINIIEEHQMGLDHGAWTVLRHIYPKADIPTFQLSIDYSKPPQFHFELAKELQKLRSKGVLILGSGNIVHNLRQLNWNDPLGKNPFDWALDFDVAVKTKINNRQFADLADYQKLSKYGSLAHPTHDHYLPLLYTAGLIDNKDEIRYTYEGVEMGSISMRSFQAG